MLSSQERFREIPFCAVLGIEGSFRGHNLVSEIQTKGITPNIVWGIQVDSNWFNIQKEYFKHSTNCFKKKRELLDTEISCFLGHLKCLELFLNHKEPWALVLEDDARAIGDIQVLTQISFQTNKPSIIILHEKSTESTTPIRIEATSFLSNQYEIKMTRVLRPISGAIAYLINRSAAASILELTRKHGICQTYDWPDDFVSTISFWTLEKPLFSHPLGYESSLIDSTSKRHNHSTKGIYYILKEVIRTVTGISGITAIREHRNHNPINTFKFEYILIIYRLSLFVQKLMNRIRSLALRIVTRRGKCAQ